MSSLFHINSELTLTDISNHFCSKDSDLVSVIKQTFLEDNQELEPSIKFIKRVDWINPIDEIFLNRHHSSFYITVESNTGDVLFEAVGHSYTLRLKYHGLTDHNINYLHKKYPQCHLNYLESLEGHSTREYF